MKQNEKVSLMRVMVDLIKADGIIDVREIHNLDQFRERYHINPDDEQMAANTTLADAIDVLSNMEAAQRHQFVTDFTSVALSDNYCARSEALLILALRYCLINKSEGVASVLSVSNEHVQFGEGQILYVESQYDEHINAEINKRYEELTNRIRLAGFDFVYIPRLHYNSIKPEELYDIVKFLYPSVSDERATYAVHRLCNLSTSEFCRDLLSVKLGLKQMAMIDPSLMLKVGESMVDGKSYSNFLLLELSDDILADVTQLLSVYSEHYKNLNLNYLCNEPGHFVYKGFHRQVFDLLMLRKGIKSTIVVDTLSGSIRFPDADAEIVKVHRREKALYTLFLIESPSGGINFTPPRGKHRMEVFNSHMEKLMRKYRLIYAKFGGDADKAPNICDYSIRGPMMSLLKKRIMLLDGVLSHADHYCISRNLFGNYVVNLPASMCYCVNEEGALVPLNQDEEWLRIAAM